MQDKLEKVNALLESQYGVDITDFDEDMIIRNLEDGEEPEAIVDFRIIW